MPNTLDTIVAAKKKRLAEQKKRLSLETLSQQNKTQTAAPRFQETLGKSGHVRLIAEIKKASPSAGLICQNFDPAAIARAYTNAGAGAISCLTEEDYFLGSLEDLKKARATSPLPLLRKDFIIDEYQIHESKAAGADAILLIAAILDQNRLKEFIRLSAELHLDALVEIHNDEESDRAMAAGASMIGINTRDLKDFTIHFDILPHLIEKIPPDKLIVCESGIKSSEDIKQLQGLRINAVLIGQALMSTPDIETQTRLMVQRLSS
jgi:indole-3-glycerol phosphate synthase